MSAPLETAAEAATRMPGRWGLTPGPQIVDFGPGLSANLLNASPAEVEAPPSDAHILSLVSRGERRHRMWHDARLVADGFLPSGSINIVVAGIRPRSVISEPIRVLHVYLPHSSLVDLAEQGEIAGAQGIEIVDPLYAPDIALARLLRHLEDDLEDMGSLNRLWLGSLGYAIATRVVHRWSNLSGACNVAVGGLSVAQLRRVRERMLDDLTDEPRLTELAEMAGLSPEHFCRAFRRSTGLPPHRWLAQQRIEHARTLLAGSSMTVAEVATAAGFSDPGYFARAFKRAAGMTPLAFRRERRA